MNTIALFALVATWLKLVNRAIERNMMLICSVAIVAGIVIFNAQKIKRENSQTHQVVCLECVK